MLRSYSFSKNTFYLLGAYISQKILALLYFIVLARYLGPEEIGRYSFALSLVMIFAIFLDFGFSTVLIREIAKNREKTSQYLSNALTFKTVLSFFIYFLIFVIINLLNYPTLTKQIVYLAGLMMIFESLGTSCYSVLRGWQNMSYESLGIIFNKIIAVGLGFLLILFKFTLPTLILPLVLAALFYFLYPFFLIKKKFRINLSFALDKKILKLFFQISLPLVLGMIFASFFSSINTVLLSFLGYDKVVGLFAVAFKISNALLFIPAAFGAAIFPVFSYHYLHSKDDLTKNFEKIIFYLMVLAVPLLFGGLVLAPQIIPFIYGDDFFGAIIVFQVLILALVFMFLDFLFSSFLTAVNRQTFNAVARGVGLSVNIFLSFLLIPYYFHLGAAIAFTVGFFTFFVLQCFWILKTINLNLKSLGKKISLIIFSAFLMALILLTIREKIHLFFSLILGFISYCLVLYLTKGLGRDDILEVKNLIKSFLQRKKEFIDQSDQL